MIYFYHIRRTGGTSLIFSILAQEGNPGELYGQVCQDRLVVNGRLIEGWSGAPSPDTYFAWSHAPAWEVNIPEDTFTVTILRDPIARLVSHYRMLLIRSGLGHKEMIFKYEWDWLEQDLEEFASRMPVKHLQRQLYMFSRDFDVEEAAQRIRALSYYFRLSNYDNGLIGLGQLLGLDLEEYHARSVPVAPSYPSAQDVDTRIQSELTSEVYTTLQDLLQPEYNLLERLEDKVQC